MSETGCDLLAGIHAQGTGEAEMHSLFEIALAQMLKTPEMTMVPQASHLLPHRSRTRVRNVSAGSSVAAAMVNVMKTSSPRLFTFLT